MKKVKDIIKVIEQIAPMNLKEDFDNVGLMVGDREKKVEKILLALDCTLAVVEEAIEKQVDLIITHHPLIFRKPKSITTETLLGKKIIKLIKNDISLYSSHTNLDSAENGINNTIVSMLGFKPLEVIELNKNARNAREGLGRIVNLKEECSLDLLVENLKSILKIKRIKLVKAKEKVKTIAIINGSGQDYVNKAVIMGADCVITGDTTYHYALDYKEEGVSIIDIGHFGSEWLAFIEVMKNIQFDFKDIDIYISEKTEDPYTFV